MPPKTSGVGRRGRGGARGRGARILSARTLALNARGLGRTLGSTTAAATGEEISMCKELFPFSGEMLGISCKSRTDGNVTDPGEWPLDRQCILRFPRDLAQKVAGCMPPGDDSMEKGADTAGTSLDLQLRVVPKRHGEPAGRRWEVEVFGERLNGTLVDLPCHVETHVSPAPASGDDTFGRVAYKSADISQMLIVHRGAEPPADVAMSSNVQGNGGSISVPHDCFRWPSGLTAPTARIRERVFRKRFVPGDHELSQARVCDAAAAIRARIDGEPYVYEELGELDEIEYQEILRTQPENVWRPPLGLKPSNSVDGAVDGSGGDGRAASSAGGGGGSTRRSGRITRSTSANSGTSACVSAGADVRSGVASGHGAVETRGCASSASVSGTGPGGGSVIAAKRLRLT